MFKAEIHEHALFSGAGTNAHGKANARHDLQAAREVLCPAHSGTHQQVMYEPCAPGRNHGFDTGVDGLQQEI